MMIEFTMRMRALRVPVRSVVITFMLVTSVTGLRAQWKQIAFQLYNATPSGVICYKDGLLWIGNDVFSMSSDFGKTWTKFPLPDPAMNGIVYDLRFFDRTTGIAALPGGTYRTTDQGFTWKLIKSGIPYSVAFGATSQIIGVAEDQHFGFSISTDGGVTWNSHQFGQTSTKILALRNGNFIGYVGSPGPAHKPQVPHGGYVYLTTDNGVTWQKQAGNIDNFDCWDLDIDSCDFTKLYVADVGEEGGLTDTSNIYVSHDAGASWNWAEVHQTPFFTGALAVSKQAVYAQTRVKGVYRSTDFGTTWVPIGGPNCDPFTRMLCAIDDNHLFAANDFGSVYETLNSGGDSIKPKQGSSYLYTPNAITFTDTVSSCEPIATEVVRLTPFCSPAAVLKATVVGADSMRFTVLNANSDSIVVGFIGGIQNHYMASLKVLLADGETDLIPLDAFGKNLPPFSVSIGNASTDTIGGDLYVPVTIQGLAEPGNISFHLHFDTTVVTYRGAFPPRSDSDLTTSLSGNDASVIIPASMVTGSAMSVTIKLTGYAARGDTCTHLTLDSAETSNKLFICAFGADSATATLCLPTGCGATSISDFMRYRRAFSFSINPDPATSKATITAHEPIGAATLQLIDATGMTVREQSIQLTSAPLSLNCASLPDGHYIVRIHGAGFVASQPLVVLHQ